MKNKIKNTVLLLGVSFVFFWAVAVVLVILGETDVFATGLYATDERMAYMLNSVCIILTAVCIPIPLKLFQVILKRFIDKLSFPAALRNYVIFNILRLVIIFIPVYFGFIVYYLVLEKTGYFCAIIGLIASLFCAPGKDRLRREFYLTEQEE